ncbi:MAG TPA: amino acid adenylation domain-containing protein [Thermoanaerobaculia bacterium]
MSELSQRITTLSQDQLADLLQRLGKKKPRETAEEPIRPRAHDAGPPPLSFSQERLWFLDQLEPGTPHYNMAAAVTLQGDLRPDLLHQAIHQVIERHEALRTTFAAVDGAPVQRVAAELRLVLPLLDVSALPEPARQTELDRLVRESTLRPFDLGRGPLLHTWLVRAGARDHVLLFCIHHIVTDGWSMTVFTREVAALYEAGAAGRPATLPALAIQYPDFALWQRDRLRGPVLERLVAYWRERLEGVPVLELPTDRPRPAVQSRRGRNHRFEIPPDLAAALRLHAETAGGTLFMVLLAGLKTVLCRWSGQDDLAVGTFIANRNRSQIEELIGFFVNNLPLRTRFAAELTFRELLACVQETTVGAYAHQDLPFEKLLEELQPRRSTSHTPIFQTMLVLQNTPRTRLEMTGLTLDRVDLGSEQSNFDLTLWIEEERGLAVRLEYATDLFDPATATRLARCFLGVLRAAVAEPGRRLWELPLLDEEERRQLLAWGSPAGEAPPEGLVHHLFAEQVRARPEAVALVVDGRPEMYRELSARAHRLAHVLRRLGVGPDSAVGVCVDPPAEVVVPLLAVLQAGGAFLPLDPAYPPDRLEFMVGDAGARLVLTQKKLAARLPEGVRRLLLDAEIAGLAGESDAAPEDAAGPESLAYIIYTSGTTGRPKGVPITHQNLLPMMLWGRRCFGLDERTRVLQNLSYGFDFGLFEILTTLFSGGCLHFPGGARGDFVRQAAYIAEHGIDTLHTTPSFLREILAAGAPVRGLRIAHLGGEALTRELVGQIFAAAGEGSAIRVFNGYGPTEVTVNSSIFEVTRGEVVRGGAAVLPIGRATAANAIYLLDPWWELVPVGVPGEFCVGGPGVARGYLARPGLSAGKFIPDPFGSAGGRLYRTGDLARWLPTGDVEFLGRIDQQVKIRGYRIELEEIEAVLRACPGVREAAVAVRADGVGGQRLAAYLVTAEGEDVTAGAVRAFAEPRLPAYMVPAAVVFLAALPLTASGKVDRRALPEPDSSRPELDRAYVAPRTPTEEVVAAVWAEVLGVSRVGIHDGFFELGGHSLLATQIVARVREAMGVELPLHAFFESPSVAELAESIEEERHPEVPPVRPVPRDAPLPLSFAQERLWFLERLHPGQTAYYVPRAVRIRGRLDVARLARAYGAMIARHEVLRTTFPEVAGRPVQVVHAPWPFHLPLVDLRGLAADAREGEARRLLRDEGQRCFDLARDPLIRATALWMGETEHLLLQTEHHLVHDGWAQGVLLRDLLELYRSLGAGRPPELPPLPVQYADFAAWQREWLSGAVLEAQVAFWVRQLAGAPPLLELPTDRPRPSVLGSRGGEHLFDLSPALADRLRAFARRQGVTLFMAMLAVFAVMLHRVSGQTDLVLGSGVANRRRPETEGMIGMMVNTLVLRADLAGGPTLRELVQRVRAVCLAAYEHQDLPFDKLVEALRPERSTSHSPIFQILYAFNDAPTPEWEVDGLRVEEVPAHNRSAKFDLLVVVSPHAEQRSAFATRARGSGINVALEYNLELFDAPTTLRLLHHYRTLLEEGCADPGRRIGELPLLGEGERQQLLVEWNDSVSQYPCDRCVHELFAEQARRTPEAVAVELGEERLTYGELERRANRLARRLRRLGAGPEVPVALAAGRSLDLIVGLLAILKSGGYYLPLDPQAPPERQALLLAEAGSPVLLSAALAGDWMAEEDGDPGVAADPDQLAYVMYTSGSTGRPKGVSVPHRAVVRLVRGNDFAGLAGEVFLQLAPLAFDASTLEIWGALLNGGRLVLMPAGTPSLEELGGVLRRHGVTTLWLTAGLFHQMVESRLEDLAGLRQLLAGGDVLSVPHVRRVRERFPGLRLINGYGPTEGTTFTCCHTIGEERGHRGPDASVPVGRPIRNTWIHVLSGDGKLQPAGAAGELLAGGDGLARGYLARPDLTAEAFVPDPFGPPGARCYRTGDRARRLADGTVEFLGRLDHQVKIRGFRIEPGEIEAALLGHPGVREAAVVVRDQGGDKRLVAFVAPAPGAVVAAGELRELLRGTLPEYMVPATFTVVDALPLGATGKVDRRALARWSPPADETAAVAAPRTPVEELLASLFAEVLGVERVGIEDGFFELGGHSLLATRLVSRARAVLGIELPLRDLFEAQTVAALALRVEEALGASRPQAPPLARAGRDVLLPLSFGQERLWFLDRLQPDSPAYNIPFALELAGRLDAGALERSLGEITRRHEVLRTVFREVEGRPVQVILPLVEVSLSVVDLSGLPAEVRRLEARRLRGEEARLPFALDRGPLLRVRLFRLGTGEHQVCVSLHHIVSDGWSVGLFVRELGALYAAATAGEPSPLRELPVQYADFAVWQRQWLAGETLGAELAYWRERLAGLPPVLELPTDRPRPAVRAARGAVRPLTLPGELAQSLGGLGRAHGATLFMVLLAGFQALLQRYSGQDDLAVGTPVAGRRHLETEPLIGLLINTLVLRADLAGDPAFGDLLARAREATLGAFAHADVPFEKVVEALQPKRSLSHTPLFQVLFQLQSALIGRLELPGLALTPLDTDTGIARFDLTLTLEERDGALKGSLAYDRDLFDAATIDRLGVHLGSFLAAMAADPRRRLSAVSFLSPAEHQQLLREWSDTAETIPGGPCVHRWIEARARRTPEATALVFADRDWSYRELDEAANRLARELRGQGIGPESLVAVCLERSAEMVLAVLAVMKTGGAYLPLDPAHPRERLAGILADAGWPLLVTRESLLADLPDGWGRAVRLDADAERIAQWSGEPLELADEDGEGLAYVIYTSGSTGKPKGVQVRRHGLANFLCTMRDRSLLTAADVLVAVTTLAFDIAGLELLLPLVTGARLVVASREVAGDGERLAGLLAASGATALQATPATWRQLLEAGWAPPQGFRALCGGEALPGELAGRLLQAGADLWNLYGPTETTIWSSVERVATACPAVVPLGRPLGNTALHLLDHSGHPVALGAAGEVCIGGAGVARGYLGRPGLTAERFVPDPFADEPGSRLYRTGDLARHLADGRLDFLGRLDHQVKIRGFRIELGEIEAALAQHPAVRQGVVVARRDPGSDPRLVAYVVAEGEAPTVSELRRLLRQTLPDYMLPASLVVLERMPLNASGKVDRRALPAPSVDRPALESAYEAPRTSLETTISEIWSELLPVERIGVDDNFFDLGGHSLLLLRLRGRLRERCGVELPLLDLFEHPTVGTLARRIAGLGDAAGPAVEVERTAQVAQGKERMQQRLALRRSASPEV